MYTVGSGVVHPYYGPGIIIEIRQASLGSTMQPCYVIRTSSRNPTLFTIPASLDEQREIRPVADLSFLRMCLLRLCEPPREGQIEQDFAARQRHMRQSLGSGSFEQIVSIVHKLYFLSSKHPLSMIDRRLLEKGEELLAGELALASDTSVAEARREVERNLAKMPNAEEG